MTIEITKESELVRLILDYLTAMRIFHWRVNTGAFGGSYTNRQGITSKRFIKFNQPGVSDILGVTSSGRIIAIECKVKRNKPTPEQKQFLGDIADRGGIAILAYSLKDVEDRLSDLQS